MRAQAAPMPVEAPVMSTLRVAAELVVGMISGALKA